MLPSLALRRAMRHSFLHRIRSFSSLPPHEIVGLPALSPTMDYGNLSKWRVKEGDQIHSGDIICDVETDKAVVEFEAQDDVFLAKILVHEGAEQVAVGQPIMVTCEEAGDIAAFADFLLDEKDEKPVEEVKVGEPIKVEVVKEELKTIEKKAAREESKNVEKKRPVVHEKQVPEVTNQREWVSEMKDSPLLWWIGQQQAQYKEMYGCTGTIPISSSKK